MSFLMYYFVQEYGHLWRNKNSFCLLEKDVRSFSHIGGKRRAGENMDPLWKEKGDLVT